MNYLVLLMAAAIPLMVGAVYYHPAVLGKRWMEASGMTEAKIQSGNKVLIFGYTYIFSLLISFTLMTLSIHQVGLTQLFTGTPDFDNKVIGSDTMQLYEAVMTEFEDAYRTFRHGALHGGIAALMFAFPVIAINSLFEQRGWKYILIHAGYWFISLSLMGGVICQFA